MKKTKMMKKNYEFRNVLSKGIYYSGKNIEAFIKKNNKKDVNFLGIAIGVKKDMNFIFNKANLKIEE